MSNYNTIVVMAGDGDLQQRFIACASQEQIPNAEGWVLSNRWALVSYDQDTVDAYGYVKDNDNNDVGGYGKRPDVINDSMVLAIVQGLWSSQQPPPE